MHIVFDTQNIYYLPQYMPIFRELRSRGHQCSFLCYRDKNSEEDFAENLATIDATVGWIAGEADALAELKSMQPDWVIFGNEFKAIEDLHKFAYSAQLGHGVGPKPSYYTKSNTPMSVRFIEGELRLKKIREMYPADTFVQAGFSKLDPLFSGLEKGVDLAAIGLDPDKKTILYAPTFNPSSIERFPDKWPSDFADCNVIVKPHTFTYTRERYKGQRRKLKAWGKHSNCYVAGENDISLLPFVKTADVLLSEASSTLFEFIALDKPVIVCDFFKLKWSYRGPLKYRFTRRFAQDNVVFDDIGVHVESYKSLAGAVRHQLSHVGDFHGKRMQYIQDHIGPTDGLASKRIVDYLELQQAS